MTTKADPARLAELKALKAQKLAAAVGESVFRLAEDLTSISFGEDVYTADANGLVSLPKHAGWYEEWVKAGVLVRPDAEEEEES